jgi:hypothetical protein
MRTEASAPGIAPARAETLLAEADALEVKHAQAASFAGRIGHTLAPAFEPLGFDWQLTVGVLTSFLAREVFVSTMSVLAAGQAETEVDEGVVATIRGMTRDDGSAVFTPATAASALVFFVLAMQCLPTLTVTRKETGSVKYAALQLGYMSGLAYVAAFLIYQGLRAYSDAVLRRQPNAALVETLARQRPDVVVHPTVMDGIYVNDLLLACRAAGIPLVVIMNSWDNISTQRYLHHNPDWLLVWGQQTYEHALRYLGMSPERVIRFGSSQFDVYRRPARITEAEFRARNDLPPGRRIVLYAGSSKGLQEIAHLDRLEAAIEAGELGDATILYRPHPWGDGGQGGEHLLDRKWKHVRIDSTMRAYLERVRAGFRGFFLSDYEDTRDVLTHIDCLVSPLSTIILEAALLGKPALCFLPMEEESMHFKRAAPLEHFKPMYESPDFVIARAMGELVPGIADMLKRGADPATPARMRKAASFFVDFFDAPYSERLATFLEEVVARHAR